MQRTSGKVHHKLFEPPKIHEKLVEKEETQLENNKQNKQGVKNSESVSDSQNNQDQQNNQYNMNYIA
jgi:hypothetical protein